MRGKEEEIALIHGTAICKEKRNQCDTELEPDQT
jgi:hypothetical protein